MDTLGYTLHLFSFLFTIIIILLGITKGLNNTELIINFLYFTILNITFLRYLFKTKEEI